MDVKRREALLARFERATEMPILLLSVVFLVIVVIPELWTLPPQTLLLLEGLDGIIWGIFGAELVVRVYLAPDRWRYIKGHWLDLLVVALPALRVLRTARVVILLSRVWIQLRRVLRQRTFSVVGVSGMAAVFLAAFLVYVAERAGEGPIQNFADALWWAMATITTVGYGDVYPKTPLGRGVAVCLMISGISLFSVLTARVAAFFVEDDEDENEAARHTAGAFAEVLDRLERIEQRLEQLEPRAAPEAMPGGTQAPAPRAGRAGRREPVPS